MKRIPFARLLVNGIGQDAVDADYREDQARVHRKRDSAAPIRGALEAWLSKSPSFAHGEAN